MARKNFPTSVLVACVKRATLRDAKTGLENIYCEECHALAKRWQIDHVNPDGLTGEPTLANARLLCIPCHAEKTKSDVGDIARAKRREAKDLGVRRPVMKSAPKEQKVSRHPPLPRRSVYDTI